MTTAPPTRTEPGVGEPLLPDAPWAGGEAAPTAVPDAFAPSPGATDTAVVVRGPDAGEDGGDAAPWGPWRVRLTYVVAFVVVGLPLFALLAWLWDTSDPAHGPTAEVIDWLSFVWILLAVPVLLNVIGALTFRVGSRRDPAAGAIDNRVCFRLVSRGLNVEAVMKSVAAVHATMASAPLFAYDVEVVTDRELPFEAADAVRAIIVPCEYQTAHGARFKARALHFALTVSPAADDTWLFHLDEETHVTPSVVRGIRDAIVDEEASGELRIGQGVVLYHRDIHRHPFLTLADSVRTGDDLGRFRLQHQFGQTAFGMHGSFILVRNDVEKEVGFDLGPAGSITEDAWWSLAEMAQGRRSRWVDGYCVEQSTRSLSDFLRQRRRWFIGLCLVCLRAPARFGHRVALLSSVALWGVGWLGWWSISVAVIVGNVRIPTAVFVVGALSLTAYSALYVMGLELNLQQRGLPWYRRLPWHVLQIVFLPFFSLLEGLAVVYGLVRPDFDFHVVKK